jgi:hypothetical protein
MGRVQVITTTSRSIDFVFHHVSGTATILIPRLTGLWMCQFIKIRTISAF